MSRVTMNVTKDVANQIIKHFKDAEFVGKTTAGAIIYGIVTLPFGITKAMVEKKLEDNNR